MSAAEALAALGAALRQEASESGGLLTDMAGGARSPRQTVEDTLGASAFEALVGEGLIDVAVDGSTVALNLRLVAVPDFVLPAPDTTERPDFVYLGPDSGFLAEAALRLAPSGERVVDLGAGTGLLAAALSKRYRVVVATDLVHRAARTVSLTMMLNNRPPGHSWLVIQSDVARGLRPAAFDLVTANAPWVPSPTTPGGPVRVYAEGGRAGAELPVRFLREGSKLLRSGGVSVTLALDVTTREGARPLFRACGDLRRQGFTVAVVPTPINLMFPDLALRMHSRDPNLAAAVHVAVIVGRPHSDGGERDSLLVAVSALARRWRSPRSTPSRSVASLSSS